MYFISYMMKEFRKIAFIVCNMSIRSYDNEDYDFSLHHHSMKKSRMKYYNSNSVKFKYISKRLDTRPFGSMGDGIDI